MSLPFLNTAPGYDEELRNSVFFERGLHATSICGAVGAAVAVAMLQGQDEAGIACAAGVAASMGADLPEATAPAGASSGSTAAGPRAGRGSGGPGPARAHQPADRAGGPLRVPAGVLRRPRPPVPPSSAAWAGTGAAARGLQTVPVQPLHPRGRGRRPAAARPGLARADVTAIELGFAKPVLRTMAEPPEAKAWPASGYHAAFSGPYTVAAALLGGGLGVSHEDFTDAAARDPRRP
ncbi:MAG: hypothetical protein QOF81_634 [Acidimicrobiaceae bacterium]|jgi:hypothetical protein|nr:hypothetical protein [Acidimicrobiaceae bacterium]